MKRLVSVSAFGFSTKWPTWYYINDYDEYNIKCKVISEKIGIFKDQYTLKLQGTEENIQMFLDYLRYEGFKIK